MQIVPRRYRFQTTLLLARMTVPLFVRTAAYREQSIKNFHRPDEIVLFLLLNALTKNGTRFDLEAIGRRAREVAPLPYVGDTRESRDERGGGRDRDRDRDRDRER